MYSDKTGFLEAARNGHLKILEFLLTNGSSVDEKNYWGKIQILPFYLSNYSFIYLSIFL